MLIFSCYNSFFITNKALSIVLKYSVTFVNLLSCSFFLFRFLWFLLINGGEIYNKLRINYFKRQKIEFHKVKIINNAKTSPTFTDNPNPVGIIQSVATIKHSIINKAIITNSATPHWLERFHLIEQFRVLYQL